MARDARRALADSRALEEQSIRSSLHGGSRFIGAGATPSMGLSQFVGGRCGRNCECEDCEDSSEEDDDEMRGGAAPSGATYRLAYQRGGPRRYTGPTSTAIVPYRPNQQVRGPLTRYIPPRALPRITPTLAVRTPGAIKPYNPAEAAYRTRPGARGTVRGTTRVTPTTRSVAKSTYLTRVSQLLALGIPIAAIVGILASEGIFDPDVASPGEVPLDMAPGGIMEGTTLPPPPSDVPPIEPRHGDNWFNEDDDGDGIPNGEDDTPYGDLTQQEVQFYLQSGNLPDRFYAGPRSKRGGALAIGVEATPGINYNTGLPYPLGPGSLPSIFPKRAPTPKYRPPPPPRGPVRHVPQRGLPTPLEQIPMTEFPQEILDFIQNYEFGKQKKIPKNRDGGLFDNLIKTTRIIGGPYRPEPQIRICPMDMSPASIACREGRPFDPFMPYPGMPRAGPAIPKPVNPIMPGPIYPGMPRGGPAIPRKPVKPMPRTGPGPGSGYPPKLVDMTPAQRERMEAFLSKNAPKKLLGGASSRRTNKRAELVREVMSEMGMSMIDASRYIKENNLY